MSRSTFGLAMVVLSAVLMPSCNASPPAQAPQSAVQTDPETAATVKAFSAMPGLADTAVSYLIRRQRGAAPPKDVVDQLRASARKAFNPVLLTKQLPISAANDAAFAQALAHYDATVTKLITMSGAGEAEMRRDATAAKSRLSSRKDRVAIERLIEIMPEPERVGEKAIALRRMIQSLAAVHGGLPKDLRTMDSAKLADGVDQMVSDTRRSYTDYGDSLPPIYMQVEAARGAVRHTLIDLSPTDMAALLAHFETPSGRARRQLTIAALEVANDQAGRAMLIDFFTRIKNLPDAPR